MKMSKEGAASFLGLRIEGDGDRIKFVKISGGEVTHAEAVLNVSKHRKELKNLAQNNLGVVSSQREWYHLKFLGHWIEVQSTLEKQVSQVDADDVAPKKSHMPSMFDNEQFREMMTVITSHQLFKKVDTDRDFAHTVNCITCGELSAGDDQQFHIGHMLYDAGFRKIPEVVHSELSK
jgi:hypothetical protein